MARRLAEESFYSQPAPFPADTSPCFAPRLPSSTSWPSCCGPPAAPAATNCVAATTSFCQICDTTLLPLQGACTRCALPADGRCLRCAREPFPFSRAVAGFAYGGAITESILRLKHGGRIDLARALGRSFRPALEQEVVGADAILPVPLHPHRLRIAWLQPGPRVDPGRAGRCGFPDLVAAAVGGYAPACSRHPGPWPPVARAAPGDGGGGLLGGAPGRSARAQTSGGRRRHDHRGNPGPAARERCWKPVPSRCASRRWRARCNGKGQTVLDSIAPRINVRGLNLTETGT